MADDGVYTTNAEIVAFAGNNANATAVTVAETDKIVLLVEAYVNVETGRNWSDDYAGLNVDVKGLLTLASATLCAMQIINYDPNSWQLATAQTKLDFLSFVHNQAMSTLRDKSANQAFMDDESP